MTIHSLLSQQHRDCDLLFERCRLALQDGNWPAAESAFGQLHQDLITHIALEEQQLFPAFEQATGQTQGPTAVMRREHEGMQSRLTRIPELLQQRDAPAALALLADVTEMLAQHNHKEERILYPWCDQLLPELAARLDAVSLPH
ncbi:hemerythrin domain-containing protein [Crenobacter sp. SG2303]|uniref:Hemerythrin domain-containing protein n=1 Tax=Crenobacter oryzisoli TaxID=3056844 RepID=A0ABT7XLT1_9NEIS|nr:hemerythrin domain-containing protein [Crenobacter sp. SG2303]MDN0074544.1 hemerythrin domain-containing protein [Crenobacter sp. SG2303]